MKLLSSSQLKPLPEQTPSSGRLETGKKDFSDIKNRLFSRRTVLGNMVPLHIYKPRAKDVITKKMTPAETEPGWDTRPAARGESVYKQPTGELPLLQPDNGTKPLDKIKSKKGKKKGSGFCFQLICFITEEVCTPVCKSIVTCQGVSEELAASRSLLSSLSPCLDVQWINQGSDEKAGGRSDKDKRIGFS